MAAPFEIRHRPGKGYHFALSVTSEHYETDRARPNGTDSVTPHADAPLPAVAPGTGRGR
ncbi:hypothetical protein [Streptomyces enissocaesilis]|uniref:Uncharacterized protein n=1 Tax=Streptomyces enissocaesilis TaxID=332589 RepID=A0ABN3X7N8_9ACTN